jgi:hypothetical protein
MTSEFSTTTAHILYLYNKGVSGYEIVRTIAYDWDMSLGRASVLVEYVYKNILKVEV